MTALRVHHNALGRTRAKPLPRGTGRLTVAIDVGDVERAPPNGAEAIEQARRKRAVRKVDSSQDEPGPVSATRVNHGAARCSREPSAWAERPPARTNGWARRSRRAEASGSGAPPR